jgi:hypothetical protein
MKLTHVLPVVAMMVLNSLLGSHIRPIADLVLEDAQKIVGTPD